MSTCPKCGTERRDEPNLLYCPHYHGRYDDGFCPIEADGETLLEYAERFYKAFLRECDEHDKCKKQVRELRNRGLLARIRNRR